MKQFLILVMWWCSAASAALMDITPGAFDGRIARDGADLAAAPIGAGYQYIEDAVGLSALAHSGAAAATPGLAQHLYGYTLPAAATRYTVGNLAGQQTTTLITPQESGRADGAFVLAQQNIILDGMLLLAKPAGGSYAGLAAALHVQVNWEFDAWGLLKNILPDWKISIPLWRGTVNLRGLPSGQPFFYTTGAINRFLHIEITETADTYAVSLDEISLPLRLLARVGTEYRLTTTVTSAIATTGDGTGAEVAFGREAALPAMIESGLVPEPASVGLLALGGAVMLWRKL